MQKEIEKLSRLIDLAHGNVKADTLIRNVKYLSVTTSEWLEGNIAIADGIIVGAGKEEYEAAETIDGTGLYAVPGFIDSHVHLESVHASPFEFEKAVLPRGTTTAVCDPHELANVCGKKALQWFLDCSTSMIMDLRVQLSSCVPATHLETSGAKLSAADLSEFINHPSAGGLAEMMNYPGVLFKDPGVLEKIALFSNKTIDGHAPLVSGRDLNAYVISGVSNDHECTNAEEALEKIRKGMSILIREGSVSKDIDALSSVITPQTIAHTALCTDDRGILDIVSEGHIDFSIRRLIANGVTPELAYIAASYSGALAHGMFDRGMIAPGKIADIVLLSDVTQCRVKEVYKRGKNIRLELVRERQLPDVSFALNSLQADRTVESDFTIRSDSNPTPVIGIIENSLITDRLDIEVKVENGEKKIDRENDILKLAVICRYGEKNIGRCFVKGFALKAGALASSVGHDSHNICVVGTNESDMVAAVNALIDCGGGYAIAVDGKIIAKVEFPVGGLISLSKTDRLVEEFTHLHEEVKKLSPLGNPFLQMAFLPLPVIPFLKLTDKGLVDVSKFSFVEDV